ncbi:MAG: hypothetical protein K2N28_01305 [Muribaculaceae bacterium]|nr:hypothetical protein [Muribaculaceae bacterium]
MKTSFYFFLWFIVYYLIGLTGVPALVNNSFVVALILVYLISRLNSKLFAQDIAYQANLNKWYIFEIFYSNEPRKLTRILRNRVIGETVWALYCILTVFGLLLIGARDFLVLGVFGFLGVISMVASSRNFNRMRDINENGLPSFDQSPYAPLSPEYIAYREARAAYTAEQLRPQAPAISKWVNIMSIVFAALCSLIGLLYMILLIGTLGNMQILDVTFLIYGVLAIYFGVKDLVASIRALCHRPTPTL